MPIANVYSTEDLSNCQSVLRKALQSAIAKNLSCKEYICEPEHITVRLIEMSSSMGLNNRFEVDVIAHNFEERLENLDEITRRIRRDVITEIPDLCGYITFFVQLIPIGYSI